MRAYIAFLKKEFIESLRTYKLLILLAVFLLFGMLNPITAKIMPEMLSSMMSENMIIAFKDPVALDSWTQFYKNMTGMQLTVFVLVFSGIISSELTKGTLINMITKGLSRKIVILSKFTLTVSLWTLSYLLCFIVTYGYTVYFFPNDKLPNILFAAFCMWLFGVLVISSMIFGSVLFKASYGCLLFTAEFAVILMLLNLIPNFQKFNPYLLTTGNMFLLMGEFSVSYFTYSTIISLALIMIFIISSLLIFSKKQI